MEVSIAGRVAVVAGGAGGIGSAISLELARAGIRVYIADNRAEAADALAAEIVAEGGCAEALHVDVTDRDQIAGVFTRVEEAGELDILVNAAGVIEYGPLTDLDEGLLTRMVQVNLVGTYHFIKEAARRMKEQRSGRIVNIASTVSFVAPRLEAAAYSMTKGGIRQLTVAAASELAPYGILVNAVAPGTTDTPFVKGTLASPDRRRAADARVPLGRIAEPSDIVGPVMFLLSSLSEFVCGQVLVVDGGQISRSP